jgi:RNA ligase
VHATALYRERYEGVELPPGFTLLFEIVYPANRIVRDYGDLDDLILIGAVCICHGDLWGPAEAAKSFRWPGPVARVFDYATLADALAAEPRPGAEGFVVRYLDGEHKGTMVKIKQDDYVALHRIITGLTSRRIWERLAVWTAHNAHPEQPLKQIAKALHMDAAEVHGIIDAGEDWQETIERTAPEEFTDWIRGTVDDLRAQVRAILADVYRVVIQVQGMDRKAAAEIVRPHPHFGLVFAEMDHKPYTAQAWYAVRPAAERPFRIHGEDVA